MHAEAKTHPKGEGAFGVSGCMAPTGATGNTAVGSNALSSNTEGSANTAIGQGALANATGNGNIALGQGAGSDITTTSNNIDIGNAGVDTDTNVIRIGTASQIHRHPHHRLYRWNQRTRSGNDRQSLRLNRPGHWPTWDSAGTDTSRTTKRWPA